MRPFAIFALLLASVTATAQTTAKFQYFRHPGSAQTYVTGVSNTGVIVGYYIDSQGNDQGFVLSNGEYTDISYPGASSTVPSGANSSGTIVGYYFSPALNAWQAFSYNNGTYTTIGPNVGCINTDAYGINDLGQIAGDCETDTVADEGWIYDGTDYQIVSVPGSIWSYASDINIHGLTTMIWANNATDVQSSIYDGTHFVNIDVPKKQNTYALAINAEGSVAISWSNPVSVGPSGGAIRMGSKFYIVEPAKCDQGAELTGINDNGLAVGICGVGNAGLFVYGMTVTY
jgi:hypothetical protein